MELKTKSLILRATNRAIPIFGFLSVVSIVVLTIFRNDLDLQMLRIGIYAVYLCNAGYVLSLAVCKRIMTDFKDKGIVPEFEMWDIF